MVYISYSSHLRIAKTVRGDTPWEWEAITFDLRKVTMTGRRYR